MRFLKFLLLIVVALVGMALYFTLTTPGHLYVNSGTFEGCPARPSCVSSKSVDPTHAIATLRHRGSSTEVMGALARHISSLPGARIAHIKPGYLHAVFVSPTMRYHDDLELQVGDRGQIDVRSISRFGYRDFGVNRNRVEALRSWLRDQPF
jgi:uncharacterized protein (DUF1499 family)